jgi:hypothetical protein
LFVPDPNPVPDTLDSVLRKYGKIWIWSILAATVAGLSPRLIANFSVMQFNAFNGSGAHSQIAASFFFLSLAAVVPSLATLVSVWYLLLFLKNHIIPILFPAPPSTEPSSGADVPPDVPGGPMLLYRAFAAVVIAIAADLVIALSSIIYRATN